MRMHMKSGWIASSIALSVASCGSSGSTPNLSPTTIDAATTTPTDTTTGTATSVATSTPTDTGTGTGTSTGTATSSLPPWCHYGSYPGLSPEAGLPLSMSVISLGTWHTVSNGAEWVLNCTVDPRGNTSCCGSLLSEAALVRAPSYSTWAGYSFEHCIIWSSGSGMYNTTGSPSISGTGYTFDETTSRIDLTGSTLPTWNPAGSIKIVECQ